MIPRSKENNFDLLRLIAALQIASYHCYEHLHFTSPLLNRAIYTFRYFFGIHILFTISGFLVYASFERGPGLWLYFRNRFLRVFPGLWACLAVTIGILVWFGFINGSNVLSGQFWVWVVTQISFLQFYTPPMLRGFGVHNPNGALWSIPVEISFYFFVPILFWLARKTRINRNWWLIIFIALSVAFNILYQPYKFMADRSELVKLPGVSIGPYLFYFLLGALAAANWQKIRGWYEGKGVLWLCAYLVYCFVCCHMLHLFHIGYWTNGWHFIAVLLLCQATLSLAYTGRRLTTLLLHHHDYSFGLYIYHMPVVNVLLALGYSGSSWLMVAALGFTTILAILSWHFVERPSLELKHERKPF